MITATLKKKIFLVDDHPLVREWLTQLINNEAKLEVCGDAENVEEALAGIGELSPDLVMLDLSLPSGSGFDLIKMIRERFDKILIIVLSMHEESVYAARALRSGAKGYVIKRETSEQITTAIYKVLDGGFYLSDGLAMGLAETLVKRAEKGPLDIEELLSERELEVFQFLGQGKKTAQVAALMNIGLKRCRQIAPESKINYISRTPRSYCERQSAGTNRKERFNHSSRRDE